MKKLIYPKKSYELVGVCMEVHSILGPGLLEIVYKDALEYEFKQRNIPFEREKQYEVPYKEIILPHHFFADFVVYDDIILEVKGVKEIIDDFIAQTLNYIALAQSPLGLIVNFGAASLEYQRLAGRAATNYTNFH